MSKQKPASQADNKCTILVCNGTGCVSGKAFEIREALEKQVAELNLKGVVVDFTGCHGFCQQGPIAVVEPEGIFYTKVTVDDVPEIVQSHLRDGKPVARLFYHDPISDEAIPYHTDITFYSQQHRIILRNCGRINPERIEDYIKTGGYESLGKVLSKMSPEQVIDEVKRSGLRGRGGAGFSTGQKWEFCYKTPGDQKYMICNADEGDPGAFMDRSTMEGDPHTVIEGMAIAAYAIGASEGYIYIRAEYPLAVKRVRLAIKQSEDKGFLGDKILGSDFNFHLHVKEGAGAFVCGEETALMASIEGKRGMPRPRPPFPAQSGLWGKPSNINNVKSLATIPVIIDKGADWYSQIGTEKSKGTVVFALTGKIANSGLVEVPMGFPLQKIIYEIGGGIPNGKRFKAVQTGGPSGGCLPASMVNQPVDYETLAQAGSIMGSGGMVIMDEDTCMVDVARYFLSFTQDESCGKCIPCRLGTKQMLDILNDITHGRGKLEDIDLLLKLSEQIKAGSLCGLGQTAPNPVLTTIRYFRDEYEEHIKNHHCRAAVCEGIVSAPCTHTCPAGVDAPRYIRFIAQGKPGEAVAVIREKIPFPSVCGYVCIHPCEAKCRRGLLDEAIGIRVLKRFAVDNDNGMWKQNSRIAPETGKRVAIVGSGPAGLTAAFYLAKLGHKVTVFESLPEAGGMMRVAIPDYRLPKDVLKNDIREIEAVGVDIKTNTKVESTDELLEQGYDAVFLATGAHEGLKIGVKGEDSPGVRDCVTFLREVSLGKKVDVGESVAVIGGGNAAIDSARTALRLGAKEVTIVYRRTQGEMPASAEEIEGAIEEGVKMRFLAAPSKITAKNGKLELECIAMSLGDIDASGRRRPEPIEGGEFLMSFDTIIAAIGQRPEIPSRFKLSLGRGNTIEVDPDSLATAKDGVFAGGDVVKGPASVIEAIAHGRLAAISIDKYLGGEGDIEETLAPPEEAMKPLEEAEEEYRVEIPAPPAAERIKNFENVELGLSRKMAIKEAERCLRCDLEEREE
ncbi:MAG TPA: NADH-quinone oxidoreductase subunit NuoF [Dehalococcoidales bacterium]|nr:NADH-quinone oxidoreductase subunit NuoF [Dehalococcoidales bacterium]